MEDILGGGAAGYFDVQPQLKSNATMSSLTPCVLLDGYQMQAKRM